MSVTKFLAAQLRQIERKHIALHDLEIVKFRKRLVKYGQQRAVKFDRDYFFRPAAQLRGQAAHARADLDYVFGLCRAAHFRDALRHARIGQEILPERTRKMESMPPEHCADGVDITKVHVQLSFLPRTGAQRFFSIKNIVLPGCSAPAIFAQTVPHTSAPPPG